MVDMESRSCRVRVQGPGPSARFLEVLDVSSIGGNRGGSVLKKVAGLVGGVVPPLTGWVKGYIVRKSNGTTIEIRVWRVWAGDDGMTIDGWRWMCSVQWRKMHRACRGEQEHDSVCLM